MLRGERNRNNNALLFFLFLIALGRGTSWSICVTNYSLYVYALFVICVSYYCVKNQWKIRIKDIKTNPEPLIFLVLLLPSMIFVNAGENFQSNLVLICSVLLVYVLTINHNKQEMVLAFVELMYFFAIVSIICFLVFQKLGVSYDWMPHLRKSDSADEGFRSIFVYSIRLTDLKRNCGPFWEPSIFAIYLVIALQMELLYLKRKDRKKIIVLLIAAITTSSSGGVVFLVITAMLWFWRNSNRHSVLFIISNIIIIAAWIGADYIRESLLVINYSVFTKIFNIASDRSASSRIYSIIINFKIWTTSPVLGVGQVQVDAVYRLTSSMIVNPILGINPSQSATPIIFMAAFGIAGISYMWLWIMAIIRTQVFNNLQRIIWGICIILMLIEVPHTQFMLTFYILFMMLHKDRKDNWKKELELV